MTDTTTRKKKLIEVALPLDEINAACKADKDRKTGTIRNLHKWFAPMPLPAWRALLFAALVDDPEDDNQRVYLLDLIKRLVSGGADLPQHGDLAEANRVLRKQFPEGVPPILDPFCGGGSTLVEAQRLGLPAYGSDLNPVPVLISRTLTSLVPRVAGFEGITEGDQDGLFRVASGHPLQGLIDDVTYFARKIEGEARERLEHVYPCPSDETPIAWLWARTAPCPNPVCGVTTPLLTTNWISKKRGDLAWFELTPQGDHVGISVVSGRLSGGPADTLKIGDGVFSCAACSATLDGPYLRSAGKDGNLGLRMTAVVSIRDGKRIYREPAAEESSAPLEILDPVESAEVRINTQGQSIRVGLYGMDTWRSLMNPRQALTLATFADLVAAVFEDVLQRGGSREWATAVTTLLGLAVGKMAQFSSSMAIWRVQPQAKTEAALSTHNLPMTWDFPEVNVFGGSVGDWLGMVKTMLRALPYTAAQADPASVIQRDARFAELPQPGLIATDPPYFDAIGYADISDFFYVWHRRCLRDVHPDLYGTIAAPKTGELTAVASRHENSKQKATEYFIQGFTETFQNLQSQLAEGLPMLVVYASKEQKAGKGEETRWSAILSAMIAADLEITGSWPIRGTTEARMVSAGTNAVASYIVMVCRPRKPNAPTCSLADFNRALRKELGASVRDLQAASILPVDLAQAAMGPGMQIFSRYKAVLDQSGHLVEVDQALRLINSALGEVLDEQEGELDRESRFAVRWWETHGWGTAIFDEADKTARPLGISVDDVVRAQVARSQANRVHLLGASELDRAWTPTKDVAPTAWEAVHHLADRLIDGGGELEAARLMARLGSLQDPAMALTYRLHDIAAKKGRTGDQERYNALINSWAELVRLSGDSAATMEGLF
jgi:putative DNA methylase